MSHDHHNPSDHQPHIMPLSMYFGVAFGLIILTVVTVWTAKFMPEVIFEYTKMRITPTIAIIIAMIIACFKAALVCLFFMHLKYEKQALVLVNYGNARGQDIFELAQKIQQVILEYFNISLEIEVNVIQ